MTTTLWIACGCLVIALIFQIVEICQTAWEDTEEWRDERWREKQLYKQETQRFKSKYVSCPMYHGKHYR